MFRLSEKIKKLEDKIENFLTENKSKLPTYIGIGILIICRSTYRSCWLLRYRRKLSADYKLPLVPNSYRVK